MLFPNGRTGIIKKSIRNSDRNETNVLIISSNLIKNLSLSGWIINAYMFVHKRYSQDKVTKIIRIKKKMAKIFQATGKVMKAGVQY